METPTPVRSLDEIASAHQEANDRTPSVVLAAFQPDVLKAAGIELVPISIQTWIFLEKIKSPFARKAQHGEEITLDQIMSTFFVIARPFSEVVAAHRKGADAFQQAVEEFSSRIPVKHLATVGAAIAEHIAEEFGATANLAPPDQQEESGDSPLPVAAQATASAAS